MRSVLQGRLPWKLTEYSYAEERFVIRQVVYYKRCFDSGKPVNSDLFGAVCQHNVHCVIDRVADVLEDCVLITGQCSDNLAIVSEFLMRVPSLAISSVTSIL